MKKLFLLLALIATQTFSTELVIKEGDQYFGKSDDGALCALAFDKVERNLQNILGYKENLLHISIEFVDTQKLESYTLRNKALRKDGVFTPMENLYFGKNNNQVFYQDSSLLLKLNDKSLLPESFTHIYYLEGRITERKCFL